MRRLGSRTFPTGLLGAAVLAGAFVPTLSAHGSGTTQVLEAKKSQMVFVGGGEFTMGLPATEEELTFFRKLCLVDLSRLSPVLCGQELTSSASPARAVEVDAFYIDRHEVVVEDYRRCVHARGCSVDPLIFGDQTYSKDGYPMVNVTWDEAQQYCEWRGARLPTEAEWEKAARGPESLRFPWGNRWQTGSANHGAMPLTSELALTRIWQRQRPESMFLTEELLRGPSKKDGHLTAAKPGTMHWGHSPYGAADMAGNVSEWVQDYFSPTGYDDLAQVNPVRLQPLANRAVRVARGGSWMSNRVALLSYVREPVFDGNDRSPERGFRCAKGAPLRPAQGAAAVSGFE